MDKVIEFYTKQVYGNDTQYVCESHIRSAIMAMTGQKTLTASTRHGLEQLGFTFIQVLPPKK